MSDFCSTSVVLSPFICTHLWKQGFPALRERSKWAHLLGTDKVVLWQTQTKTHPHFFELTHDTISNNHKINPSFHEHLEKHERVTKRATAVRGEQEAAVVIPRL